MQQIVLTQVYRNDKDKNGNPLISKQGKPYTKIAVKAKEFGDKYLSGFGNRENANWKPGDKVWVKVVENGQYLNLEMPSELDIVSMALKNIEKKLDRLEILLTENTKDSFAESLKPENNQFPEVVDDEISAEDIPF
jgi:hypothetical protein